MTSPCHIAVGASRIFALAVLAMLLPPVTAADVPNDDIAAIAQAVGPVLPRAVVAAASVVAPPARRIADADEAVPDPPSDTAPTPTAETDPHATVRGMTVSTHLSGQEWGTDGMSTTLGEIAALGANWVAIHPYAFIRGNGEVVTSSWSEESDDWLRRPIAEAHRRGLKIMIKPHLGYWGSPFSWRGDIAFETEAEWRRFFATYERWIVGLAERVSGCDAFVVGTELDRTLPHEDDWRRIVARVRERLDVPLTYAANWTDYEDVPFWDVLDVIGIQAYFPLASEPGLPDVELLRDAWQRILGEVEDFARARDRQILFTELGYDAVAGAAVEPWIGRRRGQGEVTVDVQLRCLESALAAVEESDVVVGLFLWKWFVGPSDRGNFLMSAAPVRKVIARRWVGEETH